MTKRRATSKGKCRGPRAPVSYAATGDLRDMTNQEILETILEMLGWVKVPLGGMGGYGWRHPTKEGLYSLNAACDVAQIGRLE